MKAKYIILLTGIIAITFSCISDLGNYEYETKEEVMPITISGYEDPSVKIGEELVIVPVIENIDDESRYTYHWYAIRERADGALPVRDTIGVERNLSAVIKMQPGVYRLLFKITDPERDIYVIRQNTLTVTSTDITTGWYVLKQLDGKTDFDYIKADTTEIIPNVLRDIAGVEAYENGPATIGDQQLQGKPIKMYYQSGRYYQEKELENGTVVVRANLTAMHILTDTDIKTFNPSNFYLFKDFDSQFYEQPERAVQNGGFCAMSGTMMGNDVVMINAGKLHAYYSMMPNVGKYPLPFSCTSSPNYILHSDLASCYMGFIVFDTITRTFLQGVSNTASLNKFAEPSAGSELPSLSNMNYDLVKMLIRELTAANSGVYCLMKNRTDGKYYLMYILSMGMTSPYPAQYFNEVPANSKMPEADVFHTPRAASCIYFGKGNVLSYYHDVTATDDRDHVIKTFGADEKISYIGDPVSGYLYVLTNSPSGWKFYSFPIVGATPDINADAGKLVAQGEGDAYYLIQRTI